MTGAGSGSVTGIELRPDWRAARSVGIGENPDVGEERRGSRISGIDDEDVIEGVLDHRAVFPRARRATRGGEPGPGWCSADVIRVAQNPNIIEVGRVAVVSAEQDY